MVSKATATRGSSQAFDYLLDDKGHAQELDRNLLTGENGQELLAEFREVQAQNTNCINNTYSIVLSPSNERSFTNDELRELGREHLKNLGFDLENTQYLMTVHRSTDQPHVHILANRIDMQGNAHKDNFIGKRAQRSAEQIAERLGLTTARDIQKNKELSLEPNIKAIRKEIQQAFNQAKQEPDFASFCSKMKSQGIEVREIHNSGGKLQGLRYVHSKSGADLKASEVGKEFGAKTLVQKGMPFKDVPLDINLSKFVVKKGLEMVQEGAKKNISRGFSW
jgi:DNA-binding transcriptional MerR regulator